MSAEHREEVRPVWPSRPPRTAGPGSLTRLGDGRVDALVPTPDGDAVAAAVWPDADRVLLGARGPTEAAARHGVARLRFALGLDLDGRVFVRAHRTDPHLGRSVQRRPHLRPLRKVDPFAALLAAICQQLIDVQSAAVIERALVHDLGARDPDSGLRRMPTAAEVAAAGPARLEAAGLHPRRAIAAHRAATLVARGTVDLHAEPLEDGWRRLLAVRDIGTWTVGQLALFGQGRLDVPLEGDVGLRNSAARLLGERRLTEEAFKAWLDRYAPWQGLAMSHLVALAWRSGGFARGGRPSGA